MSEYNLKELVVGTTVIFTKYFDQSLYYVVEGTDFEFPVPIEDIGNATFLASDKGSLFMRYIRKKLDSYK